MHFYYTYVHTNDYIWKKRYIYLKVVAAALIPTYKIIFDIASNSLAMLSSL